MSDAALARTTDDVNEIATGGFHLALRIGFAFPEFERNVFPESWRDEYTRRGYMVDDPVMRWMYHHTGTVLWSDLAACDGKGVLAAAARHGLHYGAAICVLHDGGGKRLRSFGSFACPDREFTPPELAALEAYLYRLELERHPDNALTAAECEAFRLLGEGRMMKEIAYSLGVSESAVKQRLANGRAKMSARTNVQALVEATRRGWLE